MHIFDLTKQIKLAPNVQSKYAASRIVLHVAFILGLLFVADRILFPSLSLDLFFNNISSIKNTLINPRLGSGTVATKGLIGANDTFIFNANPLGNFSSVVVTVVAGANTNNLDGEAVSARKSYQAFFYPLGQPTGFKDGTLLTTADGNYYIVSNGTLRKFANTNIILDFGYPKISFISVAQNDLQYNQSGPDITSSNTYPNNTLFLINSVYYQLINGHLLPFISERAFLSQYQTFQAIHKNQDFFDSYPAAETSIGFANGTLASSGASIFILSDGKSYPIANVNTFLAMGYLFNDVVALESEELGFYEQQKQFNDDQAHPDGTLFVDQKANTYFIIDKGKKRPILSSVIAKTYNIHKAIPVSQVDSEKTLSCSLKKQPFSSDTYSCAIPLDSFNQIIGNDYQLETKFSSETKIKQINLNFSTPLTWSNFRSSISHIKESLKNNYNKQP